MSLVILSAGRDDRILEARNRALIAAGFEVISAGESGVVEELFQGRFDAVVLCHSLREDDRRRLAGIIKNYCPSTPVIVVSDLHGKKFNYGTLTVPNYPAEIISAVRELAALGISLRVA
jgi:DNA-binding response OmpR family regulator